MLLIGLMRGQVEDQAIDAAGEGLVAHGFRAEGVVLPAAAGGERLGADNRSAVGVCRPTPSPCWMPRIRRAVGKHAVAHRPEFAHGHVAVSGISKVVDAQVPVGFDRQLHAVRPRQFPQAAQRNCRGSSRSRSPARPTETAPTTQGCRPRGPSGPAATDGDRSLAASRNSAGNVAVQFCGPASQLSMWANDSVLPAAGPRRR